MHRRGRRRELDEMLAACDVPAWTEEDAAAWWELHLPQTSSLRSFDQTRVAHDRRSCRKPEDEDV